MDELFVVDETTERPFAERVRTVLARGAVGTVEAGLLTRPLRSARVRDDGVIVLVVDVGGMSRGAGESAGMASTGASASVEIVDRVCTGRCREGSGGPSFAIDGRPSARETPCDDDCAVARGIVTLSGIVTASSVSSVSRRRLVAPDGGGSGQGAEASLRLSELLPLQVSYLGADGAHLIPRGDLAAAGVDPIGIDEQTWLRRLGADSTLAARLALRAGRQIAGTDPRIVGIDRFGLDLSIGSPSTGFRDVVRVPFLQVCRDAEDVQRQLASLAG
ncbi:DUF2470 domain-containing protein [Rhodococcus sp. IEGM 1408]|uniref:DUF2470 domain-containing protein n=1 Tax=Rhodococcus sp. IEGM 1408 TaxID=3082220 RepID=UPI002952B801|nr:DUF2470 domain-containing protein [Rhodococcus sp. IEGM 1408]MDV7999623.1 hypothetical protein [Rhodococcus sp. IEGM 1408]